VLKEFQSTENQEEINDLDIISLDKNGIRVAACDDSGATTITDFSDNLEPSFVKSLDTKHTNIAYKCKFTSPDQLYTTGFDYKLCQWNISNPKKSASTNLQSALASELGQEALSYNPPFCYAWDTLNLNGSE